MDQQLIGYGVQIAAAALASFLLQALKNAKWFPFLNDWSAKWWKVVVSAVVAAASAAGISYSFDPAIGRLVVDGLTWVGVGHALLAFAVSFITQHVAYERVVRGAMPTLPPGRFATILLVGILLAFGTIGCAKTPPDLTPEAQVAFQATRVVQVLDTVRDAAIAGHDATPPLFTENDTREVVSWHRTVVRVIQVSPSGWKPIAKASIYAATCDPRLAVPPRAAADPLCTPRLPSAILIKLASYWSIVVAVILEVL